MKPDRLELFMKASAPCPAAREDCRPSNPDKSAKPAMASAVPSHLIFVLERLLRPNVSADNLKITALTFLWGRVYCTSHLRLLRCMSSSALPLPKVATLADVASIAGVSAKTVSRVVNRDPAVRPQTRERIEAAIRETGYKVNVAARSLAGSRSYLVGLFVPSGPSIYFAEIMRGVALACRRHGYHLVIEEFEYTAPSNLDVYLSRMRSALCDALILAPPISDDTALLDALDKDGVRYVRISPTTDPARSPRVYTDDAHGVRLLVQHLWDKGRRDYVFIAGPKNHLSAGIRERAFVEALHQAGADPTRVRIEYPEWQLPISHVGWKAIKTILANQEWRPNALFAFNDEVAIGALAGARDAGLRVPDDLAVAGFDDSEAAVLTYPALTTIHQPIAKLAGAAVNLIIQPDTEESQVSQILPTRLIVRGST